MAAATITAPPSPTFYIPTSTVEITLTPELSPTRSNRVATEDQATLVHETYHDNSILKPGEKFIKTFEIKNTGSKTWTSAYTLVLDPTSQSQALGSPPQLPLPQETPPGSTVTLSINLAAPAATGTRTVYWILENERGETVPVDGGSQVWVKIRVCDPAQPCNPPTAGSGTTASGIAVTLTGFTYDAESATVSFCMTMPNRYYSLGSPAPSLLIDQKPAPFLDGGSIPPWGCVEMRYQASADEIDRAQDIRLSIDTSLRMAPPPGDPDSACQAARLDLTGKYPGLDFQCQFSMAGYATNLQLPPGMTRDQANQIILDTIEGAIYGPWILHIKG
jgi:hypothetical protein